jgi:predicted nucleic acid-binding protein
LLARAGIIPAAKPHLDQMIAQGFGVPAELYTSILHSLGE